MTNETIESMLTEREARYGSFAEHAKISQSLKAVMFATNKYAELSDDKKESLEMIMHKVARILNGSIGGEYKDNWIDIAGYATLVTNTLKE